MSTVIAHRGASGHRPENTLGAFELAYRLGADSVETDLVATRDGVVVCSHDLELSRTTNVASLPELGHLRRNRVLGGRLVSGWFVHDLTWEQVSMLRCRERWPRKRANSAAHDGRWGIPRFDDLLALAERESARRGVELRVNAELKCPSHLAGLGLDLVALADRPDPRVTWMSFDGDAVRRFAGRPAVQLFLNAPGEHVLDSLAEHATAIGVRRKAVVNKIARGGSAVASPLVADAHARGLGVYVWTLRPENKHLPKELRIGLSPFGHGDAQAEARALLDAGVDGLIADFPETVTPALTPAGIALAR